MSMSDRDGFIWKNGSLVNWRDAQTHVLTHSLHYGMAVFEGIRSYENDRSAAVFRLKEHTKRFVESAKIVGMKLDYSEDQINSAILDLLRANKLKAAYIRPLVFYGPEKLGVAPPDHVEFIIAAWSWGRYFGDEALTEGIRVKTSSFTRHHVNINMCRAKASCNYANSILALTEVQSQGFDEALLLDVDGYVCEGSGENLFLVKDSVIYTPDLSSALNGVTRRSIMQIATSEFNMKVVEKRITRDEVYIADEVFFTGTAVEVTPIREVDCRIIGGGRRGEITERLQKFYLEVVRGKKSSYSSWLTEF